MTGEVAQSAEEGIVPGLIVRHTSRRLGRLGLREACERLVGGGISFSEFVDQVGEGYQEVLNFMMEHDLHPGRPDEVLFAIECYAEPAERVRLVSQLEDIHGVQRKRLEGRA